MDYLFHQHYSLQAPSGPFAPPSASPVVLLAETEPEALALYARHLANASLLVSVCLDLGQLLRQIRAAQPHLLVINPAPDIAATITALRQVAAAHPGLPIITVGAPIPDPYLDRLMATGVALHINRTLSQPRDIAVAARQILGLA
jgi:DNA-binding NtrC family response regulator